MHILTSILHLPRCVTHTSNPACPTTELFFILLHVLSLCVVTSFHWELENKEPLWLFICSTAPIGPLTLTFNVHLSFSFSSKVTVCIYPNLMTVSSKTKGKNDRHNNIRLRNWLLSLIWQVLQGRSG